ncbi:MAG: serine/threonine protein kinase, partial [Acidobacteria bacterium]
VRVATRRRQMGDIGVTAQRYSLVLYGNSQQLKLEPWEPEIQRTVTVPFTWKADAWYHLKLRVENSSDGKVRARGKAWPTGETEPTEWMIDKMDPMGNRQGAPGIFAFAPYGAFVDNLKLVANQ